MRRHAQGDEPGRRGGASYNRAHDRHPRQTDARTGSRRAGRRSGRTTAPTDSIAAHTRDEIFSIDTPPPTVSGSLHMGSAFGYVQTDAIARYQRMRGPPRLLSDGLGRQRAARPSGACRTTSACAASRTCRTTPAFVPPEKPGKDAIPISRPNFLELCERLVAEDEEAFEQLWRRLGLSVDWTPHVHDDRATRRGARASARSCATSRAARRTRPTRRRSGTSTSAPRSPRPSSKTARCRARTTRCASTAPTAPTTCWSTRPGPSCSRRASRSSPIPTTRATSRSFGSEVITPLYGVRVPVVAHHLADPEKGTGIAMICTFGDTTDVVWWRELQLPTRADPRRRRPVQGRAARRSRAGGRGRVRARSRAGTPSRRRRSSSSSCARRASSTANPARSRTR